MMVSRSCLWISFISVISIPVAVPAVPSGKKTPPHVFTGPFIVRDVIAITADTRRARDRTMEQIQIKPHWKLALGPEIPSFNLTIKNDEAYSTPSTPDGKPIRQITYEIAVISPKPLDTVAALNKFHDLMRAAGLPDIWAFPDRNGNMVLTSTVSKVPTTSTARDPGTKKPVVVHAEFHLPDSLAIIADTRLQRNRTLDEIKPIWRKAFGHNVTDAISFTIQGDNAFNPPNTPDGKPIRRIDYTVDGMSTTDLNFNEHADQFHVLALKAGLPGLWAVPDPYGNWIRASSGAKKTTTTTGAARLAVKPAIVPLLASANVRP